MDLGRPHMRILCVHSHLLCCYSHLQPFDALMQVRLVLQRDLQAAGPAAQLALQHMLLRVSTRTGRKTKMVGVGDKPMGLNLTEEVRFKIATNTYCRPAIPFQHAAEAPFRLGLITNGSGTCFNGLSETVMASDVTFCQAGPAWCSSPETLCTDRNNIPPWGSPPGCVLC